VAVSPQHSRGNDADKDLARATLAPARLARRVELDPWSPAETTYRLVIISSRDLRGDYRPRQDKRTAQGRWEATG
jgi:hypothetical protein